MTACANNFDKYGLPNIPTKMVEVELEAGVKMGVGEAAPIKFTLEDGSVVTRTGGGRHIRYCSILMKPGFLKGQ